MSGQDRRSNGRAAGLALAAALLGAACTRSIGPPVAIDLAGADPAVIELLTGLAERARAEPDDPERRGELGLGYDANGFQAAAEQCYEEAAALDPVDPRWPYHLSIVRAARGELEPALETLARAIAVEPAYAPAYLHSGQWLLDLGRPAEAEAAYRRALELAPDLWAGRVGLARALLRSGRAAEVPALLAPPAGAPPGLDPNAAQLLMQAYRETGQLDRARTLAAQARGAGPTGAGWPDPWSDDKSRFLAGFGAEMLKGEMLLQAGRSTEAVAVFEALRQARPGDVQLLNNLAIAYRRSGRDDDALAVLLAGVEEHPGYFPFHMNLGNLYETRGQLERALEHFERAGELNPALGVAHQRRGNLLIRAGRIEEAFEAYESALGHLAQDPALLVQASRIAASLGRCERAVTWFDSAVRLDPALGRARGWIARCEEPRGGAGERPEQ